MLGAHADQNLLFGILALQLDFVNRDQLVAGLNAWVLDKSKPLAEIFVGQGVMATDARSILDALVAKHLEFHHGDPKQSLQALRIPAGVQCELDEFADQDVQASLRILSQPESSIAEQTTLPIAAPAPTGDRFEILRPHAWGGLGEVCIARDRELNREVALKRILERHSADTDSCARFQMEAEITGGLEHPGIVPVYALGASADGRPYYAMRFIRGETLKEAIRRHHTPEPLSDGEKRLELRSLLGRFIAVCNAIEYAHSRGVIHRDIKPNNIMLGKFGETLVVDWGLAKAVGCSNVTAQREESELIPLSGGGSSETLPGSAIGTPSYMSPEQADGRIDEIGPASDIYSLGATLYTLLTGKEPFEASVVGLILAKVQTGDFVPPRVRNSRVPGALSAICMKAMSLSPADRYASCLALAQDIEHWLADEPVTAYAEPISTRLSRWVKRHRAWAAALGVLCAAVFIGLGVGTVFLTRSNARISEHANEAERQRDAATHQLYVSQLNLAQRAWDDKLAGRTRELLETQIPEKTGGRDLRGWEWHYLARQANSELRQQKTWAIALKFHPDGKSLFAGSLDGMLNVWTSDGSQLLNSIKAHGNRIPRIALTHDGKVLVTGGGDGLVKFWDSGSLDLIHQLPAPTGLRYGLAVNGDATSIAVSSRGKLGDIEFWSRSPGPLGVPSSGNTNSSSDNVKFESRLLEGHTGNVLALEFTCDGKFLISGAWDGTIRKWDALAGREALNFAANVGNINAIAVSPDGKRVAFGGSSGNVKIADLDSGRELLSLKGHAPRGVTGLAFSSDGSRLVSCSNDTLVAVWNALDGREIAWLRGHASHVSDVDVSPDGKTIASGGWDETLKFWDTASYQEPWSLRLPTGVTCVAYSPDGKLIAAGDGLEASAWDATSTVRIWNHPEPITSLGIGSAGTLSFDPSGRMLLSALSSGSVNIREASSGRVLRKTPARHAGLNAVAASPDGKHFATGAADGEIGFWSIDDGSELSRWKAHKTPVLHVAFSPDGRLLASAAEEDDMRVRIWDTVDFTEVRALTGHEGSVFCIAFSPDGKLLFTGSKDETIRWWDVASGQMLRAIRAHSSDVLSLAVSPDGKRLASSGSDQTLQIRDILTGQEVMTLKPAAGTIFSVAFSPDGRLLAGGTMNQGVLVWDARTLTPELRAELNRSR